MSKKIENFINISETQRDNLAKELATLTCKLKKEISVECIYIIPATKPSGKNYDILTVVIVSTNYDKWERDEWLSKLKKSYHLDTAIEEFGVKIIIDLDDTRSYTCCALNPSELIRQTDLLNATILLDKSGEYYQIKNSAKNSVKNNGESEWLRYYSNLAEIQPPLIEKIYAEQKIQQEKTGASLIKK